MGDGAACTVAAMSVLQPALSFMRMVYDPATKLKLLDD
jgi:hypothetical protein